MMKDRVWERWDDPGVAKEIDLQWITDPSGMEGIHREVLAQLTKSYLHSPSEKVLEVGCGSGLIYNVLVPEVIENVSYAGVDTSLEMLSIARERFPVGDFAEGDIFGLKFPSNSFDVTLCYEVLGHLPEIEKPISELFRVAARLLIFTVWVSPSRERVEEIEQFGSSSFIRRSYPHTEILAAIRRAAGDEPYQVETRVLTEMKWAYIVSKGGPSKAEAVEMPEVYPFWGFTEKVYQKHIEETRKLLKTVRPTFEDVMNQSMEGDYEEKGMFADVRAALATSVVTLEMMQDKGKSMAQELDVIRQSPWIQLSYRFLNKSSLLKDIRPKFQQLKDDSLTFNKKLQGYRLRPSINLQKVPFLFYPLDLNRPNLSGVLLAPVMDFPASSGIFGIEIISPSNTIVAQSICPAEEIDESVPTQFSFSPIPDSDRGRFWLRVLAREVDIPTRILEWHKFSMFGFGRLQRRAFCGFVFGKAA